jgi:hypothetical protein
MYAQNDRLTGRQMKLVRLTAAALALACVPLASHAQGSVDIIQIWQNFVASRVAANECGGVEKATEQNFLANLTTVTARATQAIQERNPTISQADLASKMESASGQIHDKVEAEIKQNGCSSSKVQQLLKLYAMHAAMKL